MHSDMNSIHVSCFIVQVLLQEQVACQWVNTKYFIQLHIKEELLPHIRIRSPQSSLNWLIQRCIFCHMNNRRTMESGRIIYIDDIDRYGTLREQDRNAIILHMYMKSEV